MNLLVVDDEKDQLESLRRGLRSKGYRVLEALAAGEALEHLKRKDNEIGMVLLDYAMPGMNGMELLENIRKAYGSLPVIIMSAYAEKNMLFEALHNHCDGFIEKPFTLNRLVQEIERVKSGMLSGDKK